MDVNSVINKYYGIFKENDNVVLFNLIKGSIVDTYESVKNYGVSATNEFGIVKKIINMVLYSLIYQINQLIEFMII